MSRTIWLTKKVTHLNNSKYTTILIFCSILNVNCVKVLSTYCFHRFMNLTDCDLQLYRNRQGWNVHDPSLSLLSFGRNIHQTNKDHGPHEIIMMMSTSNFPHESPTKAFYCLNQWVWKLTNLHWLLLVPVYNLIENVVQSLQL